jgi:hypothetical protein
MSEDSPANPATANLEGPTGSGAIHQPPIPPPPVKRHLTRRILRGMGIALLFFVLAALGGWASLAVALGGVVDDQPRQVLGYLVLITFAALLFLIRKYRIALATFAVLFTVILIWYLLLKPTNNGDWTPDVADLAWAQINGDQVVVHNIRNFDYRTETDFTPARYDRAFDLRTVSSGDIILCYWGPKAVAHGIVSIGFEDGSHLAMSIEARRTKSQHFSMLNGFFRNYGLIYVIGDERDLIRLRTNYRDPNEQLYLYRVRLTPDQVRAVLLSYLKKANSLRDHPQFYNALTDNCITGIVENAKAGHKTAHMQWETFLSGYAPRQMYENGVIDTSIPLDHLTDQSLITPKALAADKDPDFSAKIRVGLPTSPPQ